MNSHTSSKKTGYAMRQQNRVAISEPQAICWLFLAALILELATLIVSFFAFTASETLLLASSVKAGETPEEAAVREVMEELGLDITVDDLVPA